MKQKLPAVTCIYTTEAEKSLSELLEESFRLYLIRTCMSAPQREGEECVL